MKIATMSRSLVIAMVSAAMVFSSAIDARSDGEFLTPFDPAYPPTSAGGYDTYINGFTIPVLPANSIAPGFPPVAISINIGGLPASVLSSNEERCDTDAEGLQQIALATINAADTLGNTICNAITPETAESPCWIGFGILQQVAVILQNIAAQCAFQDALVDGAEIEAGYENTVKLIALGTKLYESQMEATLLNCRKEVGLILPEADGGLAEWVAELVQDRIDQYTPIISDPFRIVEAQDRLDQGNIDFALGNYEDAYSGYCKAYGSLVAGKGKG